MNNNNVFETNWYVLTASQASLYSVEVERRVCKVEKDISPSTDFQG